MNRQERSTILLGVRRRFELIDPYLTELTRRVWVAAEALAIGAHGKAIVAEATGVSRTVAVYSVTNLRFFSQNQALVSVSILRWSFLELLILAVFPSNSIRRTVIEWTATLGLCARFGE
jgi:hypothetical protein